jgi:hypothetical protein
MSIFYCFGCQKHKDNDYTECFEHNGGLICEDCLDKEIEFFSDELMISDYECEQKLNEGERV